MKKPKLEKLIQEIAMFDMVAAFTLYCRVGIGDYKDKDDLSEVMNWLETPEGHKWWDAIYNKLEARREKYHPHRDSMIEYANDKTIEIEYLRSDGSWEKCEGFPSFFEHDKYRKKPKLVKKVIEYRIYLDKENNIKTNYGKDQLPLNFEKWLVDWQKVEIEVEEND